MKNANNRQEQDRQSGLAVNCTHLAGEERAAKPAAFPSAPMDADIGKGLDWCVYGDEDRQTHTEPYSSCEWPDFFVNFFFFLIFLKISSTSSREEKIICTVRLSHSLLHTRLLWSCLARELSLYISLPEHTACSIQRTTEINISVRFPFHYLK